MKSAPSPLKAKRASGIFIELEGGETLIDCISSWWVNVNGHCRQEIAQAIYQQSLELDHVLFAGFTHQPAQDLASGLIERLPQGIDKIFFSDNGSTAIEVAIKMALQFWRNIGDERKNLFLTFEGGYHGDTVGAMSVGGSSAFWNPYRQLMFETIIAPFPSTFEGDAEIDRKEEIALCKIKSLIDNHAGSIAAAIIEPLVQGAAGMKMCRPQFLLKLSNLVASANILTIYDEVMTGFGRTGEWFAASKAGTHPDIICLSKGIAGGFLPLAVTGCSNTVYEAFLSDDRRNTLYHGHSFTANPISCAAGVASLKLLRDASSAFRQMETWHRKWLYHELGSSKKVENIRFCGTISAFEVVSDSPSEYFNKMAPVLYHKFIQSGLLIRPLGNTIYIMPPYCISEEQLAGVYRRIGKVLRELD
jgi:adenosylmethionine-8-amino-7-oxononanoate aminotransferase